MYAKLHNNALMPAPNPVPYNGCSVANPPAETLRALGYKEVIYPDAGPADPAEEPGGEITTFQPVPMREVYTEDAEYIYVNFVPAEPEPGGGGGSYVAETILEPLAVLAHSSCTLDERVEALENRLTAMQSGRVLIPELQVEKLSVWGGNNLILTGAGAPTLPPDRAGQFYIDTKNNAVYKSTGNAAVADWKI